MSEWTPAQEAELQKLLEKGLSRKEIGEKLGFSRNAVSGKISRLRKPGKKTAPKKSAATNAAGKAKTATEFIADMDARDLPLKLALRKIEWSRSKCSWPTGDPKEKDFNFCGKDVVPGKPYCNDHCFEAYTTGRELQQQNQAAAQNPAGTGTQTETEAQTETETSGDETATASAETSVEQVANGSAGPAHAPEANPEATPETAPENDSAESSAEKE